jgi:hypothetical protein
MNLSPDSPGDADTMLKRHASYKTAIRWNAQFDAAASPAVIADGAHTCFCGRVIGIRGPS